MRLHHRHRRRRRSRSSPRSCAAAPSSRRRPCATASAFRRASSTAFASASRSRSLPLAGIQARIADLVHAEVERALEQLAELVQIAQIDLDLPRHVIADEIALARVAVPVVLGLHVDARRAHVASDRSSDRASASARHRRVLATSARASSIFGLRDSTPSVTTARSGSAWISPWPDTVIVRGTCWP